ncbi:MAG: Lrp/AsnC family transcriptional regulator [Candidatus Aminicenantales bacterium]
MIDELEEKIIRVMNRNARKSFREIAKEVGTSATAVINKVKKLEAGGVIKGYIPIVNPEHFGLELTAIVALRISKGKLLETQQKIAEDHRVTAVYDITGEWDSLVIGSFKGRDDLNDFIKGILSLPYVDRTVTHIVLNVVKEEKRVII